MTFNGNLFLDICREYGVEFSKEYPAVMLKENGCVKELCSEDMEQLLLSPQDTFLHTDNPITVFSFGRNVSLESLEETAVLPDEFLTAA